MSTVLPLGGFLEAVGGERLDLLCSCDWKYFLVLCLRIVEASYVSLTNAVLAPTLPTIKVKAK
eukprot:5368333-Amphidinium_carterae.1